MSFCFLQADGCNGEAVLVSYYGVHKLSQAPRRNGSCDITTAMKELVRFIVSTLHKSLWVAPFVLLI